MSTTQAVTNLYSVLGLLGMKGHASWKPRVTEMHILSFVLQMMHSIYTLTYQTAPTTLAILQFAVMGNLLVLFTDFHHQEIKGLKKDRQQIKRRRLVFSFDSSGWFYVYHYGVAKYLQAHVLPHLQKEQTAFSGSSGGALVAASLCADLSIDELVKHVISCQPRCEFNPWQMLPCAEEAMHRFRRPDFYKSFSGRLSVLVTRIEFKLPFVMGEAVSDFRGVEDSIKMLRASCHVPLLGGVCPYKARGRWYYDGFFWPSFFVPWRQFDSRDTVMKVSAIGTLGAQITPSIMIPIWWMAFPPKEQVLWGMFQLGYADAARFFRTYPNYVEDHVEHHEQKSTSSRKKRSAHPEPEVGSDLIHVFEDEAYRAWLRLAAMVAGTWLTGLTLYALYADT
uniref:PNPLA domain-containing protein n=1 Tax=Lotharella oceanica TaxID=641309 RepID=A0A7S2X7T1_9EUKA